MPLLDRLNQPQNPPPLVQDIALNLERVLNTRRGVVPQDAGLGLIHRPAVNLATDALMADELLQAIKTQIAHYEPRLLSQSLQLEVAGEDIWLTARFQGQRQPLHWQLSYQTDNYLSVLPGDSSRLEKVTQHV
ncbi:Predicted component of the type VI protein secretion system [Marinospirillum celere]|uniref:Predicted component of the type VI protein secretion system n=1 Tax=Marinospirillum celere TaxID=1122252 RepID=A0A1I1H4X3_9GAMM|nr:GPW/gp25 family protein [Marinospirillum celere]SFC18785.1 Predicted component of the type VI protein secretion system [Marinospirillum celere]